MGKRKEIKDQGGQDSDGDEDIDLLDVEFEWFEPKEVDFHGIKSLLKQLFDVDHESFDLSGLTDLIIAQPGVGSVVKTSDEVNEAEENDPFALLTVLNLHTHSQHPAIRSLATYIERKVRPHPTLSTNLLPLLSAPESQVGLVLSERFINMPTEVVPSSYHMLLSEISIALAESEPFAFTHYLLLSKTYIEIMSKLESAENVQPPTKKGKKCHSAESSANATTFFFHPEDEVLQRHALAYGDFRYDREGADGASDSKRAFQEMGIRPMGHVILIEASRFEDAIGAVEEFLKTG